MAFVFELHGGLCRCRFGFGAGEGSTALVGFLFESLQIGHRLIDGRGEFRFARRLRLRIVGRQGGEGLRGAVRACGSVVALDGLARGAFEQAGDVALEADDKIAR